LWAGIAALSRDAASEVQPRFGDEEKTRFVGVCRPFAKSRHAAANRRYSNSKLISGRNPLRGEAWKNRS
jgi:hypothetical protein